MDLKNDIKKTILSIAGAASGKEYRKGGAKAKGYAKNPSLARRAGRIGGRKSSRWGVPNKNKNEA